MCRATFIKLTGIPVHSNVVDPAETRTPAVRTVWGTYEGYETSETCFGIPGACAIPLQFLFRPKTSNSLRYLKIP